MGRIRGRTPPLPLRTLAGLAGVCVLTGLAMVVAAPAANAEVRTGRGHETTPAQQYQHNPDAGDWLGSYLVDGKQVFCVQFGYRAPDSDQRYQPGEALRTKWGTELPADVAADISYLLLRYGNTDSDDNAAALAHLLHSWTAAPQNPSQLDPSNDFRHIAYDADAHLAKLPEAARLAVVKLRTEAAANRGPWQAAVDAPDTPQLIGKPATWTVKVTNAAGKGVGSVPVAVALTDATIAGPGGGGRKGNVTLSMPKNGSPLRLDVTPTGPHPTVAIKLAAPAERPVVRNAVDVDTQRVVSTGGEQELTAQAATDAVPQPGAVRLNKTDAKSGEGIAGAVLRLTAKDRTSPAVDQKGDRLLTDGRPLALTTDEAGTATVADLRAPQEICLVEVTAPAGYEQGFDANSPPAACGTVQPGQTLVLALTNTPNVPTAIPAGVGGDITPVAHAKVVSRTDPVALAWLGTLLLCAAGVGGLAWRRHGRREHGRR